MSNRPASLPDYNEPPIDEVVIAVQFPPIADLTESHVRDFWKSIRDEYPISEHQPRIEGAIESSGPAKPFVLEIPTAGVVPPPTRTWMISDSDDFLLQVQNTRLIQNKFWASFNKFRTFLISLEIPTPQVQQVEVTYFNWIPQLAMADYLLPAANTVINVAGTPQAPEEQSWSSKYLLQDEQGLIQRLYLQAVPAVRPASPGVRGSQLALIFRAAREDGLTDDEMASLIDSGHIVIVDTFTQITAPNAQQIWGRYQ